MPSDCRITRRRLEIQGFMRLDDEAITTYGPWLRLAYGLCTTISAIGVVTATPAILWAMLPVAVLGTMLPFHPFDLIYNLGVRHLTGTGPLPRRGAPARFACGLATVMLTSSALAFQTGHMTTGYIVGGILLFSATLVSTTDICIPSLIYRSMFGFPPKTDDSIRMSAEIPAQKASA